MIKANKVWTPNGYQEGPVNSLVGKGESIIDYTNGTGTLVTKGKVGVDNQPSSVHEDDSNVIAGNDKDWTNGMKFSDQIAPLTAKLQMYNNIEKKMNKKPGLSSLSKQTAQLQKMQVDRAKAPILQAMKQITDRQQAQHEIQNYNCGKNRFASGKEIWGDIKSGFKNWTKDGKGKVSNATLDFGYTVPALLETTMLNRWNRERPQMPDIYAANRYAPIALRTMASNRISPYSTLENLNAQDRQAAYQIANSGGYTGGQRQNARVALALGAQRNAANALMNIDEKNAAYRNAYADMAARLGDSEASRQQQANQYAYDAYNKAYSARTKGIETHLANLGLLGQKWLSQRIKNKQYGDILDIYQQDVDNKRDAIKALYGTSGQQSGGENVDIQNNQTKQSPSSYTHSGDLNILNKYYHNTPLGDVFSIQNPYRIPQIDASMQRIPKGKYWMLPDQMPSKRYNSDQIRQAISDAQNTRQWAQNRLNQNEMNWGTIGDGNIIRDIYLHYNEPNNYTYQSKNRNPKAMVTYVPGIGFVQE